jgi:riboflavin kinase/FMN adenylyltransferase
MRIIRSLEHLGSSSTPSVVTIGNFDGVHCGHQMVIAAVLGRARELGIRSQVRSVVVTFDPHPAHVLHGGPHLRLITPSEQKLELLAKTGIDTVLVLPFDEHLRRWSAREFATRVLRDGLNTLEIHEGETFRFGYGAESGIDGLLELGRELGFGVTAYVPHMIRGSAVSSSRIRSLISAGRVGEARVLLGRPFAVRSTPAPGRGYGTRYAVPTVNLAPYENLLPGNGVYLSLLRIGDADAARLFRGLTNVGNRPTFGADSFAVETHLLDFEPLPLDETTPLELTLLHRLRDERRFRSPEALRAQIGNDVTRARRYFALSDALGARLAWGSSDPARS